MKYYTLLQRVLGYAILIVLGSFLELMKKPLVSVLMPFYNGGEFINEAISSLENQTYKNFELIVVDDCSPQQDSAELLRSFKKPWLKTVRHESNQGLASSRNTAFELSQGELLLPFDQDDILKPSFLETTVEALVQNSDVAGAYTQVQIFGLQDEVWIPSVTMLNIMSGIPGPSTILFRRPLFEEIGGFTHGMRSPDSDFWIRALSKNHTLVRIEEPLYCYRKHSASLSQTTIFTEVSELAAANLDLYKDHLLDVIALQESEVQRLKREYLDLEEGFKRLDCGYIDLLERYDNVVKRLCQRSIRHQINKLLTWKRE